MMQALKSILLSLCMLFVSHSALAQATPVTVDVELSRSRVYVGDQLTYQVIVRGTDNPSSPQIEFPDSVRVSYNGRSSHSFTNMRIVNGKRQSVTDQRYSFQYTLTAVESGIITIPAPQITVNGQDITGQSSSFESTLPVHSDADEMLVFVERDKIYLNETVEVECTWWIGNQTSDFSFASTKIPSSFQISPLAPPSGGEKTVRVTMNDIPLVGVVMTGQHFGQNMTKLVFRFSITPEETGSFHLGPIRAVFTRHSGTGQNFRAYIESESIPIQVQLVPSDGQPDGYAGAIGTYRVHTKASNSVVNVGDPIELTYRVVGDEPMAGLDDAPALNQLPGFSDDFRASSEGWRESLPKKSGMREFTTTIRALNPEVDEIPAIGFSSFHPESNSYEIYQSSPIPIEVKAVEVVTLADAVVTGGLSGETISSPDVEHTELTPMQPGLWAHGSVAEILSERDYSYQALIRDPIVISATASGPILYAITMLLGVVRSRDKNHRRILCRAYAHSRQLEKQGQTYQSLRHYLATALDINTESIVSNDAFLLPIDRATAQRASDILSHDEAKPYLNSETHVPSITQAPNLLKEIHTQILDHRLDHP